MKMMGVIFSNIYDKSLAALTNVRAASSIPFGGRYRLIDFILSNMVNSDITTIGIIAKYNYSSLMDHLHYANDWDLERKDGGLYILPPFGTGKAPIYQGKLDALSSALDYLNKTKQEYVVISDSTVVCNIDFNEVLKSHIASGCDITCVAHRENGYEGKADIIFEADCDGNVKEILVDSVPEDGALCGMGMYIMKRTELIDIVEYSVSRGYTRFEGDFLQRYFYSDRITANVYEFKKTILRNNSIPGYFENNMKLLSSEIRKELFLEERPVLTKVRNEPPTIYSEGCQVRNSMIADGCDIKGLVENSIIFRDVIIEPGAIVKNSVIMQGTKIKSGAYLNYAILDKDVTVNGDKHMQGDAKAPVIIDKGMTI